VVLSAVAQVPLGQPSPWYAVYFYYKHHESEGPIALIGSLGTPSRVWDDEEARYWAWDFTLVGEDIPDIGQIDVFAVGVQFPYDGWGVFATGLNSNIVVNSYVPVLVGDQDGFGLGLVAGDERPTAPDPYFDQRQPADPPFTDVMPATVDFTYTHTYSVPVGVTVSSATLRWLTLGIQDGDSDVAGSDTDIRLYVDAIEVPGAFDDVDQFYYNSTAGAWVESVGLVEIPLTGSILGELTDGEVEVRIQITQLGSTGTDAIAIDYSELLVEYDAGGL
jgi:hypothetical protein